MYYGKRKEKVHISYEGTGPEFQAMKFNGLETAFEKAKEFLGDSLGGEQIYLT